MSLHTRKLAHKCYLDKRDQIKTGSRGDETNKVVIALSLLKRDLMLCWSSP